MDPCRVLSHSAVYTKKYIEAHYQYETTEATPCLKNVEKPCGEESCGHVLEVTARKHQLLFRTERDIPALGVMLVGLGGNNATTMVAGILANKHNMTWNTKTGLKSPNWFGSLMLASTTRVGRDPHTHREVHAPLSALLPLSNPETWIVGGWDINNASVGEAMRRAMVLDIQLQDKLYDHLQSIHPLPGIYIPDFVAANQKQRANHVLTGTLSEQLDIIRSNIRDFKLKNNVSRVIVLWTATTERFCEVTGRVHTSAVDLLAAIAKNHTEISPSTLYAAAAILEGCCYINGSPQNTIVPGIVELAQEHNVFVGGDDFKTGQTKLKSVLVDFLVSAGLKPTSIVSYNHLGNNDGQNLSSFAQFRSKEISKSNVVDDMVQNNHILYKEKGEYPDHCVVIKYVPYVGDSKRAMDEYVSEIFLNGMNTLVIHNTCEDSLLAAPIMIDLILLTELFQRITVMDASTEREGASNFMHVMGELFVDTMDIIYLCKAPLVPQCTPVVNALGAQRTAIVNVLRACIGLMPESNLLLEYKIPFLMEN